MSHFIGRWHGLTESGHTRTYGEPASGSTVLYEESIKKKSSFMGTVTHTFSYNCREEEEITAVLAYDKWSDNTGGYPEKKSGGVGCRGVSVRITSQFSQGFNFQFVVYGKLHCMGI
jgi:hypothetical protein